MARSTISLTKIGWTLRKIQIHAITEPLFHIVINGFAKFQVQVLETDHVLEISPLPAILNMISYASRER